MRGGPVTRSFCRNDPLIVRFALICSEILAAVVKTKLRQLPPSLVVLNNQRCPHQEWFSNIGYSAARQAQHTGQDIQSGRTVGQDLEVLRLGRPQPKIIDSLQATSPMKMIERDGSFAFGP